MGKNNINPFLNSIKKLPELSKALDSIDMDKFASSIARVTTAIKPLASEMNKVSSGFSALPTKLQRVIYGLDKSSASAKNANKSFGNLFSGFAGGSIKITAVYYILKKVGSVLGGFVSEGNDYIENLNLFEVAMGSGAKSALAYAETVNKALGIDVSEFIRNQGVFKQVASGFGVIENKANLMSKNLTTLGYDISSFFNISVEDAMQKTQSGISGEIEPLRRLGYALDQATLQQVAYENGIKQKVSTMTQAQKSQLRYIAIMQQSTNVMGDMARTVLTPSNAMRILEQQITQLKRAIGNILIPVLIKVIPYVQAFIRVLTEAAQKIANLMGFKLPTIDYSNVGKLGTVSDDLDGIADSAKDTAKALKPLAGFDELNILSFSSGSAGAEASGLGNYDLGLELPEYDFLGDVDKQAEGIYRKVKDWLEKIAPHIKNLGILIGGLWATQKLANFLGMLKNLAIIKGISKLWSGFADGFSGAFKDNKRIFKSLNSGLKGLRKALSPLQKTLINIAGAFVIFTVVKSYVYDATTGTKSWGDALKAIIPITVLVGAAMWILTGPIGAVIAGVAAIAGAIYGFNKAQIDMSREATKNIFFNGEGVPIDSFTDSLIISTQEMSNYNEKIIEMSEESANLQSTINNSISDLDTYMTILNSTGQLDPAQVDKMRESFGKLVETMKTDFSLNTELIFSTFNETVKQTAINLDLNIGEMITSIQDFQRKFNTEVENSQLEVNNILDKLSEGSLSAEDQALLEKHLQYIQDLGGSVSETQAKMERVQTEINQIDWGANADEAKSKLDTLTETMQTLQGELDAAQDARAAAIGSVDKKLNVMKDFGSVSDEEFTKYSGIFAKYKELYKADYVTQKSELQSQFDSTWRDVASKFYTSYNGAFEEAYTRALGKAVPEGGINYTSITNSDMKKIRKYMDDSITETQKYLQESISKTGTSLNVADEILRINNAPYAQKYYKEQLQKNMAEFGGLGVKGFIDGINGSKQAIDPAMRDIASEMKKSTSEMKIELPPPILSSSAWQASGTSAGKYLQEGTEQGVSLNSNLPINAIVQSAKDTNTAYENMQGIHSPSKVYEGYGMFQMQGLSNGVKLGVPIVLSTISSITSRINTSFSSSLPNLKNSGIQLMQSFTDGINQSSVTLTDSFNVILDKLQLFITSFKAGFNGLSLALAGADIKTGIQANIVVPKMYANGGFPAQGEMFIANEAGPELVGRIGNRTAVANDSQITSSIERAVYRAMVTANAGNQNDRPVVVHNTTEYNGRIIAEETVKYMNGQKIKSNSK